jgi:translocation and assembly module TamB
MAAAPLIKRRTVRYGLTGLATLVILLIALAWALTGALGRMLASELINGRNIAGYGEITIEDISGNMLSSFTLGRVEVQDAQGVWLVAEQVHVDWNGLSVLGSTITIASVDLQSLDIERRPERAPQDTAQTNSGSGPGIQLEHLRITAIDLSEGVLGPQAAYTLDASLSGQTGGAFEARVALVRTDATGDQLTADISRSDEGALSGDLSVTAPAGGPLAELLQLSKSGWTLQGEIGGDLNEGSGSYTLQVGSATASDGQLSWQNQTWQVIATADPTLWPMVPDQAGGFADGLRFEAAGRLDPIVLTGVEARSQALTLDARLDETQRWQADLSLSEDGAQRVSAFGLTLGGAQASVSGPATGPLRIDLALANINHAQAGIGRAGLSAVAQRADDEWQVEFNGDLSGLTAANPHLAALLGAEAGLSGLAAYGNGQINLSNIQLNGPAWQLNGSAGWDSDRQRLDADARLDLQSLTALEAGFDGPISARITTQGERRGWERVAVTVQSPGLGGPPTIAPLLRDLSADLEIELDEGLLTLPLVRVETSAATFSAQAHQSDTGDWQAEGDLLVDVSAIEAGPIEGELAAAFELQTLDSQLNLRSQVQTGTAQLAGMSLTQPTLRLEAAMTADRIEGQWRFDSTAEDAQLQAVGGFMVEGETARLQMAEASWSGYSAVGELTRSGEQLSADLSAISQQAGRPWSADIAYTGSLTAPLEGLVVGSAEAQNWLFNAGDLLEARLEFDGPLSGLPFTASARGHLQQVYTLTANGEFALQPDRISLQSDLTGRWFGRELNTRAPLNLVLDSNGLTAGTRLRLGDADIRFDTRRDDRISMGFEIRDAQANWLSDLAGLPPVVGQWDLDGDLSQTPAGWTGDITAQLEAIRSQAAPDNGQLDGQLRLSLAETARLSLSVTAGTLVGNAALEKPEAITDLSQLLDPGWRGDVTLDGQLETLARIYLPATERFSGIVDASARFEDSAVSGEVRIVDGAFRSQTAGVQLSPFSLQASFAEDQLRIERAELGDGNNGRAEATGSIGFTDQGLVGNGEVRFTRFRALARPDLSATASGNAALELRGRTVLIRGEADIERLTLTPTAPSGSSITQIEVEEINRPERLNPAYRSPIQLELDYAIRADDALFVSSQAFNSEWATQVQVTGPLNRLQLEGNAEILNGEANLFTRVFRIDTGVIRFSGPLERTRMDIAARHERPGLEVIARAEGLITQPRISFESVPDFPEDEVLSRLLFDQTTAALSPLQAAQLAAQLSGQNWLAAINEAGRAIGVDRLDLREGENGELALRGGRQISEDVYLELETSTAAALGAARIEWSITPNIVVLSRLTGDTNGELAIRWRREYD